MTDLLRVAQPLRGALRGGPAGRLASAHHSPGATRTEIVGKVVYLRQHYHYDPRKISMYLKRYHDVAISPSGVWRILIRLELSRLPTSQRYKRDDRRWKR